MKERIPLKRRCTMCGSWFTVTPNVQEKLESLGFPMPVRCKQCNELKKQGETLKCQNCGKFFVFTKLQERQLQKKYDNKFRKPRYCSKCRTRWREENAMRNTKN